MPELLPTLLRIVMTRMALAVPSVKKEPGYLRARHLLDMAEMGDNEALILASLLLKDLWTKLR